jgi:hypothetical protein
MACLSIGNSRQLGLKAPSATIDQAFLSVVPCHSRTLFLCTISSSRCSSRAQQHEHMRSYLLLLAATPASKQGAAAMRNTSTM